VPEREEADLLHAGNLLQSGLVSDAVVLAPVRMGTRSKLFSDHALSALLGKARRHPLFLDAIVKRGAQPSAGTSLAGLNNSRCGSLIGCYGISERLFIVSYNLCESSSGQ
jgi:hypothetical protein